MTSQTSTSQTSQDLHNRGWGFAFFIVALAIVVNIGVFALHKATYLEPSSHATQSDHAAPSKAAH
jgi:hypothetical protein